MTNDDPKEVYEVMPIKPGLDGRLKVVDRQAKRPPETESEHFLDHGRRSTMISCISSRPRVSAQERSVSG
jgi:hypothetical protein